VRLHRLCVQAQAVPVSRCQVVPYLHISFFSLSFGPLFTGIEICVIILVRIIVRVSLRVCRVHVKISFRVPAHSSLILWVCLRGFVQRSGTVTAAVLSLPCSPLSGSRTLQALVSFSSDSSGCSLSNKSLTAIAVGKTATM